MHIHICTSRFLSWHVRSTFRFAQVHYFCDMLDSCFMSVDGYIGSIHYPVYVECTNTYLRSHMAVYTFIFAQLHVGCWAYIWMLSMYCGFPACMCYACLPHVLNLSSHMLFYVSWPSPMGFKFSDICDTDSCQCCCTHSVWIPIVNMPLLIINALLDFSVLIYLTNSWMYPTWIGADSFLTWSCWWFHPNMIHTQSSSSCHFDLTQSIWYLVF